MTFRAEKVQMDDNESERVRFGLLSQSFASRSTVFDLKRVCRQRSTFHLDGNMHVIQMMFPLIWCCVTWVDHRDELRNLEIKWFSRKTKQGGSAANDMIYVHKKFRVERSWIEEASTCLQNIDMSVPEMERSPSSILIFRWQKNTWTFGLVHKDACELHTSIRNLQLF